MRDLLDDGSRSLVFLIDTAGCAIPATVRNGKDARFRRSVAIEYGSLLISTAERLLAHADTGAPGGVLWTYRIFDSRDGKSTSYKAAQVRSSLSRASKSSIEEFRKALIPSLISACETQSAPTTCIEKLSAAITDGISAVAARGFEVYSPDSFLESTDTDATPTKKAKQEREKIDNEPLVVVLAAVPQSVKEVPTFLHGHDDIEHNITNQQVKPGSKRSQLGKGQTLTSQLFAQLESKMCLVHAFNALTKSKVQLLWIHAYSRRSEESSCLCPSLVFAFKEWVEQKKGVNAFEDLHSLLLDRSIAPFTSFARRIARPALEKALDLTFPAKVTPQEWIPADLLITSTRTPGNVETMSERMLKIEFFDVMSTPLPTEAPKKYLAICVALSKLGSFETGDETPGLARVLSKKTVTNATGQVIESFQEPKWAGMFSGLMLSLAQAGLSLVVHIYCSDSPSAKTEPHKTVMISALTPLSAVVRKLNPTQSKRLELNPVTPGCMLLPTDSNALRKRIFPGLGKLGDDCTDSTGHAWPSGQNARFFEAHLSAPHASHDKPFDDNGNACSKALQEAAQFSTPHNVTALLENLNVTSSEKQFDQLRSAIENFNGDPSHGQESLFEELGDGQLEMDKLEKILKQDGLPQKLVEHSPKDTNSPNAESVSASKEKECQAKPSSAVPGESLEIASQSVPCTPPAEASQSPIANAASALLMMSASPPSKHSIDGESKVAGTTLSFHDSGSFDGTFGTICGQIDEDIGRIKSIDKDDLIMQCNVVVRSLGRLVDFGRSCQFAFAQGPSLESRVRKLKKIEKAIKTAEGARDESRSSDNFGRILLFQCMRSYEQATLNAAKQAFKFQEYVKDHNVNLADISGKPQRVLEKSLKRTNKFLNIAQAVAVSQDRYYNVGNPYLEIFDEFFNSVISRFYVDGNTSACAVAKVISEEFEKSLDTSRCSVSLNKATDAAASTKLARLPETQAIVLNPVPQIENPLVNKRSHSYLYDERGGRDRKRPRTKDPKKVLVEATASRNASRIQNTNRRDSGQGLRSFQREKSGQLPLRIKPSGCPKNRLSLRSSDPLFQFNMGRRMKYSLSERLKHNISRLDLNGCSLNEDDFYASVTLSQPESNMQNEVLVPGTPSDNESG